MYISCTIHYRHIDITTSVQCTFQVQYIIDTVIEQLVKDPKKKFIYVEVAFFKRWWEEQDKETRQQVKNLVTGGQLEFINGG